MQAQISLSSTKSFELREALLIYRTDRDSERTGPSAFVTKHSIAVDPSGAPSLGAGSPIQEGDLLTLCAQLRSALPIEFLPSNVLVRSEDSITWWTPASMRRMFYAKEKSTEVAQLSGKRFPQPPLVFRARKRLLEVRALLRDERPNQQTALYRAPYWNVNDDGDVCLGTARVPSQATVDSLPRWESAFFESEFTHPNASKKLTEYPGGFVGLWRSLAEKRRFPAEFLAAANQTLHQFITS
ncbi:PRTRC genetic system protein B [Edaphobacter aggregans]|uniref:PRTRC genetic system protein B n=1 Tax=Edaphobacter aggregans TaxID=570835 RepID=A0A428MP02_9BACT|nr:PRTRC system protein B [Edaphobacter aggregans]RSL18634.1 PRTRC genetic system protein B [Edaphobacter aggregans]